MFSLEDTKLDHVSAMCRKPLRKLDIEEWEAGSGTPVLTAFPLACVGPDNLYLRTLLYKEAAVAIWGVSETEEPGIGCLWLMACDFEDQPGERQAFFKRVSREEVSRLHWSSGCETLMALADDRNRDHHAWLRVMGFTPLPDKELGADHKTLFTTYVRRMT